MIFLIHHFSLEDIRVLQDMIPGTVEVWDDFALGRAASLERSWLEGVVNWAVGQPG